MSATDSGGTHACTTCGRLKSGPLRNNCPFCLVRLCLPGAVLEDSGFNAAEQDRGSRSACNSGSGGTTASVSAQHLGDYELLEEIGRGGMGVIYRARQRSLNRTVAVKVLLPGHFSIPAFFDRFRHEAISAASLNHPHIVSVYEVGSHLGQPFYSMELIEGRSLAELVREQPLPARQAASLLQSIAAAVHFAHEQGVLHRDLKPSNVIVDAQGEPHVADFGLAKRLEMDASTMQQPDLTLTGQVIGSPNFMPPEQADPKLGPTTVASDVYSLGAILYQVLTGRPPFLADTLAQTLRLVTESEVVSPRLLRPGLPVDLETICLRCLERDPARRYASARELALELSRFLRDEPIHARPVGPFFRMARWCRRKPAFASALGAAMVLVLLIAIGSPIAIYRIDAARRQQEALRTRAEAAEQATSQQLYTALLEQARATVLSRELGQRVRALDALRRAAALSNSVALRREVLTAMALPDLRLERELPYGEEFTLRALDPGFTRIAIAKGRSPVEIRSTLDGRLLHTLAASTNLPAYVGEWSPDGRFLAIKRDYPGGGLRSDREIWAIPDGQGINGPVQRVWLLQNVPRDAVAFHPTSRQILVGTDQEAILRDLSTGAETHRLKLPGLPSQFRLSPDGRNLAALCEVNGRWQLSVQNLRDGALLSAHDFEDNHAYFNWHPDGHSLAVCDHSGLVQSMDAASGRMQHFGRHMSDAVCVEFDAAGNYLVSGGWERELVCWDARTGGRSFLGRLDSFVGKFRNDGRVLAVLTASHVALHSFERPEGIREFDEDLGTRLLQASFSEDGRWLMASGDKQLGVWDLTCDSPGALEKAGHDAHGFFSPGGNELWASRSRSSDDTEGFCWQLIPGSKLGEAPRLERLRRFDPATVGGFSFLSLHSNSVVITSIQGSQILPRLSTAVDAGNWKPTVAGMNRASPDGRWLGVLPHYSPTLDVYSMPTLQSVARLTRLSALGYIYAFEFSPRGDEVCLYSSRGMEFWKTMTWERTRVLTNFSNPFLYAADGKGVWLTERLRHAGLYDAVTLQPRLLLPVGMMPLAVSRDDRLLAVSVQGQRLQVWDMAKLREQFRGLGIDWTAEGR